jgi:alcohol dehydrogenase (cytochrome c)
MKTFRLLAFVLVVWVATGVAQTTQELLNTGKNTDVLTTHSMGYDRKSYSPLRQINKTNVKRLVPVWTTSVWNEMGELAAPAIYNGVMYVINGRWTFALDARNGRQIWRTPVTLETGTTGAPITRGGPVLYNGKLFRITYDNHLVALDMKTGKELWNQKYAGGQGRVLLHGRAHHRQRRSDLGDGWGRADDARIPRRMGPGHREKVVAQVHHSRAR